MSLKQKGDSLSRFGGSGRAYIRVPKLVRSFRKLKVRPGEMVKANESFNRESSLLSLFHTSLKLFSTPLKTKMKVVQAPTQPLLDIRCFLGEG